MSGTDPGAGAAASVVPSLHLPNSWVSPSMTTDMGRDLRRQQIQAIINKTMKVCTWSFQIKVHSSVMNAPKSVAVELSASFLYMCKSVLSVFMYATYA